MFSVFKKAYVYVKIRVLNRQLDFSGMQSSSLHLQMLADDYGNILDSIKSNLLKTFFLVIDVIIYLCVLFEEVETTYCS